MITRDEAEQAVAYLNAGGASWRLREVRLYNAEPETTEAPWPPGARVVPLGNPRWELWANGRSGIVTVNPERATLIACGPTCVGVDMTTDGGLRFRRVWDRCEGGDDGR